MCQELVAGGQSDATMKGYQMKDRQCGEEKKKDLRQYYRLRREPDQEVDSVGKQPGSVYRTEVCPS